MTNDDPAEIDRWIDELTPGLRAAPPGTPERRAALLRLTQLHTARYVQHDGPGSDQDRADVFGNEVLTDPATTPRQRQLVRTLLAVGSLVSLSPARIFRGHRRPALDEDALRRAGEWMQDVGPAEVSRRADMMRTQLDAIGDLSDAAPELRAAVEQLTVMVEVFELGTRPNWSGELTPELVAKLRRLTDGAPADLPGRELIGLLIGWIGGDADASGDVRIDRLRSTLDSISPDHLMAPVLGTDLARALVARAADQGDLREATELLQRARTGMDPDHVYFGATVQALGGALLVAAGQDPTAERLELAHRAIGEVLGRPRDGGPADRGTDLFLTATLDLIGRWKAGDRAGVTVLDALADAAETLPVDHVLRPIAIGQAASVLADRYLLEGRIADAEEAGRILRRVEAAASATADPTGPFVRAVLALCRVVPALRQDDLPALRRWVPALREALDRMPARHVTRPNLEFIAAIADLKTAAAGGDRPRLRSAVLAADDVLRVAAPAGVPPAAVDAMAEALGVLRGLVDADPATITESIARLEAQVGAPELGNDHRVAQRVLLGQAYLAALETGVRTDVAHRAVLHLATARRLLSPNRPGVERHAILRDLARAFRAQGDHPRARETAAAALAALTGEVLLQSGVGHGVRTARGAADEATVLTRWCLTDGDLDGALRAVESGRGLALHAATSALAIPELLRGAGRDDLVAEWERETTTGVSEPAHDEPAAIRAAAGELRHEVVDALRTSPQAAHLFEPPGADAVAGALTEVGADALVYLVPGDERAPGHLLALHRDGGTVAAMAEELRVRRDGPVTALLRIDGPGRSRGQDRGPAVPDDRRVALDAVCDWAGRALLDPLRQVTPRTPGGSPRLVLVPGGVLAAVPWAAARSGDGRYACQDMVLSTAASARQLVDVAARPVLGPPGRAVLVTSSDPGLPATTEEVSALRAAVYPDAAVLTAATPAQVLGALPPSGTALLHLACHATSAAGVDESCLSLTERLPVRDILRHGAGRAADAPGGLVVLSACRTDLTEHDYDESVTLSTAFLAAGATSAVGSRWSVRDEHTAVFMVVFHRFVTAGHPTAEALARTQRWCLTADRDVPQAVPGPLRSLAGRAGMADPTVWAAFGHHGR